MKQLIEDADIDYMDEPHRTNGRELLDEMLRLQAASDYENADTLWTLAAENLGNHHERYCGFYICLECGAFYHSDYSTNSDPDRDFCGAECEADWVTFHPDAEYNGELKNV